MELLSQIAVRKTLHSKIDEVNFDALEFGKYVADHMLICDYADGEWQTPSIVPYTNLSLNPATLALHYGQTVFEGMKAFRMQDGRINIFRIDKHYERFARSLDRLCMAVPPKDIFTEGLQQLIDIDKNWVPSKTGEALYLRPFVYASEARFGVKISEQYRFIVFSGPVPELYAKPIRVKVETNYVRAAKGGTGYAKCGGNYGASYYPTKMAREQGYEQVIWTDAKENRFIEESGMMNIMFVIDGILVTPPLSDSILDGVTRDSLLTIANDLGYATEERAVAIAELERAFRDNAITAAFGAGTAAVVAPIQTICIEGVDYHLPAYNNDSILYKLKDRLNRLRTGLDEDLHHWNTIVGI